MNKKIIAALLITMSIFAAGCGARQAKTQAVNSTSKTAHNAQKINYTSYSGSWLTENSVKDDYKYGMGMTINVDKDGNLKGQLGNASDNASHIANVDIKGKIQDNKLSCDFSEDGWEHSGTVNLSFRGSKIIVDISYKSGSSQNNLWGIGEGTFTLIKSNTEIESTLSDLKNGGLQVIDNQCFKVDLNNFGKVKFISGWKMEEGSQQAYFYLIDDQEKVIYKFPHFYGNQKGTFSGIKAISFSDVNNDGLKDVIIIAGYNTDTTIGSIYFQKEKEFINNKDFDNKLNSSQNNKTISEILKYAKQNLSK